MDDLFLVKRSCGPESHVLRLRDLPVRLADCSLVHVSAMDM